MLDLYLIFELTQFELFEVSAAPAKAQEQVDDEDCEEGGAEDGKGDDESKFEVVH